MGREPNKTSQEPLIHVHLVLLMTAATSPSGFHNFPRPLVYFPPLPSPPWPWPNAKESQKKGKERCRALFMGSQEGVFKAPVEQRSPLTSRLSLGNPAIRYSVSLGKRVELDTEGFQMDITLGSWGWEEKSHFSKQGLWFIGCPLMEFNFFKKKVVRGKAKINWRETDFFLIFLSLFWIALHRPDFEPSMLQAA